MLPYYLQSWHGFKFFFEFKLHKYRRWRLYWGLTRKTGECWCCGDKTQVGRNGDTQPTYLCYGCAFLHPLAVETCKTVRDYSAYLGRLEEKGWRADEHGIMQPPEIASKPDFKHWREAEVTKGAVMIVQFLGPAKKESPKRELE